MNENGPRVGPFFW